MIFGYMYSNANIYLISLLAIFSEFTGKYCFSHTILKNLNELLGINSNEHKELIENAQCTLLMATLLMISFYLFNFNKKHSSFLVLFLSCTRFYGHVYFEDMIPKQTITYASYLCAFSGCLFSHYIKKCLEEISIDKTNFQTSCNTRNILIKNSDSPLKSFDSIQYSNDKKPITRSNMRRKTFNYNNNNSSSPSSLYKRRTSLPIKFESDPINLLLNEIQSQVNNILNNSEDIISNHHIFKSLNVITNLIVQAKFNSEQKHSLFKDQERHIVSHKRLSVEDNYICKQQRSRSLKSQNLRMGNILKLVTSPDSEDYNETKSKANLNLNLENMIGRYNDSLKERLINESLVKNADKTSDYDSGESPNSSDYNSDTDKLQNKDKYHDKQDSYDNKMEQIKEEFNNKKLQPFGKMKKTWNENDLKDIQLLERIYDWNFPIFELSDKSNNNILSHMAFAIFKQTGLFKTFDIPTNQFINFFTSLESGYNNLPYHNKIHAADVLHACYYLTTSSVPGIVQLDSSEFKTNIKKRTHFTPLSRTGSQFCLNNKNGYLGKNFTPLELLALFCSAAMHDYEHPGRNNQFLININSPLAVLYNDKSVLENHHVSSSWCLLKSDPKNNFLSNLEPNEWKLFRSMVIEFILATDLSKHSGLITDFEIKIKNTNETSTLPGLNWQSETDRLLIGQMIIKLADINAPLKEKNLHIQWTERICEEFYQQGEEELELGLPQSPHMNRSNPRMAKLQKSFINVLVSSLCNSYESAGLLPGIIIDDPESFDLGEQLETNEDSMDVLPVKKQKRIFYSELSSNLKTNYEMWCELSEKEEETFGKA